jgi:hypothetical protein
MRRAATILRDDGGYNLAASQMNPVIFEEFVGLILDGELPPVIWEPFAGRVAKSPFCDFAEGVGVTLLAQTLNPVDDRILAADSTVTGPQQLIGGMLFHPPYYASTPSDNEHDVVHAREKGVYLSNLGMAIDQANQQMVRKGLACVVGRDYRIHGERIHLDIWMLELFQRQGYRLVDVWSSEPDIVLIFRRAK